MLDTDRRSVDSDSTIFSDTEGQTAIATEDLDFSTMLRLGTGCFTRQVEFNWSIDQRSLRYAKRCARQLELLELFRKTTPINGRMPLSIPLRPKKANTPVETVLLRIAIGSKSTDEPELARKAWSLLSPDTSNRHARHITEGFCQYFFHLHYTLQGGGVIPFQIPVNVRAKIDRRYGNAFNRIKSKENDLELAKWISSLSGKEQGVSLIALLEIETYTNGPPESCKLLHEVLKLNGEVGTLRHATEDQISNFFATYVRAFRAGLGPDLDQSALTGWLEYFSVFWSLCTAQYNNQMADNHLPLFKATIKKLDIIDIPLCLWIFLAGHGTSQPQDMEDPAVDQIYLAMKNKLNAKLPNTDPEVIPVFTIVQFVLSAGHGGFFDIMHYLMEA